MRILLASALAAAFLGPCWADRPVPGGAKKEEVKADAARAAAELESEAKGQPSGVEKPAAPRARPAPAAKEAPAPGAAKPAGPKPAPKADEPPPGKGSPETPAPAKPAPATLEQAQDQAEAYCRGFKFAGAPAVRIEDGRKDEAIDKGRVAAWGSLAQSIHVRIESFLEDRASEKDGVYHGEVKSETKSGTGRIAMTQPDREKAFTGYDGGQGYVVYAMCASESTAEKWKRDSERLRLERLLPDVNAALASLARRDFGAALKDLNKAKEKLRQDAEENGGALQMAVKGALACAPGSAEARDARSVDAQAFVVDKIRELTAGVRVESKQQFLTFSADGRLNGRPKVRVVYDDKSGREPASFGGAPLRARFAAGSGRLQDSLSAGSYGEAELRVDSVDPSSDEAVIEVALDEERLGLGRDDMLSAKAEIKLRKLHTLAVAVVFTNCGKAGEAPAFASALRDALGVGVVEVPGREEWSHDDLQRVWDTTHADQLVAVALKAQAGAADFYGLHAAEAGGRATLYALPSEQELMKITCPKAKKEFSTREGAGERALAKISGACVEAVQRAVRSGEQ